MPNRVANLLSLPGIMKVFWYFSAIKTIRKQMGIMTSAIKHIIVLTILVQSVSGALKTQAQSAFDRVEPSFWWVGMKNTELQILFYSHDQPLSGYQPSINYPGVTLLQKMEVENPHYLFLKLQVSATARAG